MREVGGIRGGGGGAGGGGTMVAAAVAVLERQALSAGGGVTPSVKTQTPQDNQPEGVPEFDRTRKSSSPLSRSESLKRLGLNGASSSSPSTSDNNTEPRVPKVTVIGARLKCPRSPLRADEPPSASSDVDALCSDLMSSLEQALDPGRHSRQELAAAIDHQDISKSSRSGFAYVDLRHPSVSRAPEQRHSSSTNESAATSEDFDNSSDESTSSSASDSTSETASSDLDENEGHHILMDDDGEEEGTLHVLGEGLETITEEERPVTASSVRTTEGGDTSSPDDDSTLKGNATWSGTASNHDDGSTSDLSSTTPDPQQNAQDSSTCCNKDFQWIHRNASPSPSPVKTPPVKISPGRMEESHSSCPGLLSKPPINRQVQVRDRTPRRVVSDKAPGSLDRRRHHHHQQHRQERDQKSKSTHVPSKSAVHHVASDSDNQYSSCQNWCCNPRAACDLFENFHRRHERVDPQRYGSSQMLQTPNNHDYYHHGSHPDLYSDYRYRHEPPGGCCMYHTAPLCCRCVDSRNYRWTPPPNKTPELDDRLRRLQSENDNLQKEVFVLNERIDAQCERISELERALTEKKQQLGNAEDLLQREMLSRSSLETQKLELMSSVSELKLQHAALERENLELRSAHSQCHYNNNTGSVKKPPLKPRASPQPSQHTSTPVLHHQMLPSGLPPSPSPVSVQQEVQAPKTPPATYRRQVDLHYGSLPRQQYLSNGGAVTSLVDTNANPTAGGGGGATMPVTVTVTANGGGRKGVAFVKPHSKDYLSAETEKIVIDDSPLLNDNSANVSPQPSPSQLNKNRGIKKIFGRMKRSGSGNLEDLPGEGEFRRGGIRATAGPRLGWNESSAQSNNSVALASASAPAPQKPRPEQPFSEWDTETLCEWIVDLGLDMYVSEAKRWLKNGAQLQAASAHDLEKELGIKNVLHRKKLQLAILDETENTDRDRGMSQCDITSGDPFLCSAGRLDTAWVLRWLDDTGLPQHKDAFLSNRIDGRMLHRLTLDDLQALHVTSVLQVASLRRGIQVLRQQHFEPGCLQRRSLPDEPQDPTPEQVALWSAHRVMEWLRAVDLAEYAPNLRGAGVHGALMILEPKFTAELLATLLSIPPSKTLLRRHLNTHFKELLGRDVIQEKREAETTLGYTPLTPAAKIKVTKKSQFSLKKKKDKGEMDYGDLVCPLNSAATQSQSGESNGSSSTSTSRDSVGTMKTDTPKAEVVCHLTDDPALVETETYRSTPSPSPLPLRNLV